MNRWKSTLCIALLWAGAAAAWGPQTESAIVTGAARILAKETSLPLTNLLDDIRSGAQISDGEMAEIIPGAAAAPVDAIADQMYILQAVRSSRIDPYYAYRMGVLGKLVASITAPMPGAKQVYRDQYFSDVEQQVKRIPLQPQPRRQVDPAPYFTGAMAQAASRQDLMVADYKAGIGFSGVAKESLANSLGLSVNAVADVWYTILSGEAAVANISQELTRRYYLDAISYFLGRGYGQEASEAFERLEALGVMNVETRLRIADMYYDAGSKQRAVEAYERVLAEQPGNPSATKRLAQYYVSQGDAALEEDRLYDAQEAYQHAVDVDPLDAAAKEKLVAAENTIAEREDRLNAARGAVDAALAMERQAEAAAEAGEIAQALETLKAAAQKYASVTPEFPEQRRMAEAGRTAVAQRLSELRRTLLTNALEFSGAGASAEAPALAAQNAPEVAKRALKQYLQERYQQELQEDFEAATTALRNRP